VRTSSAETRHRIRSVANSEQSTVVIVEGVDIGKLPFAIAAEQAAREMARLIERRVKRGIVPAFPWRLVRPFLGHLPERLARV